MCLGAILIRTMNPFHIYYIGYPRQRSENTFISVGRVAALRRLSYVCKLTVLIDMT